MLKKNIQKEPLRLAVFGMGSNMFKTFEFAMQKMGEGLATIVNEDSAEAAVFNLDDPQAKAKLEKYRQHYPEHTAIVLSVNDPELADCIFVKKPFTVEGLLDAIRKIKRKSLDEKSRKNASSMSAVGLPAVRKDKKEKDRLTPVTPVIDFQTEKNKDRKFCGIEEDVDLSNPEARKNIYYSLEESLQSRLDAAWQRARQNNNVVIVSIKFEDDLETITLLPRINKVITALDDKKLSYLCTVPVYCLELKLFRQSTEKSRELEEHALKSQRGESLESLFWKVALWTSRGRVPVGTDLNSPMVLRHWPNFTRLHITPGAFSIAALLNDKPMSLTFLISILSIPQRYVFAFYSSAQALDLIERVEVKTENEVNISRADHVNPHRKLFGRIMQKLKRTG